MKSICLAAAGLLAAPVLPAIDWPQGFQAGGADVVVYQPQPEAMKGDRLTGRAAFSWKVKDAPEPVFGSLWFDARVETDRDARTAVVTDFRITRVRVPAVEEQQEREISSQLQEASERTELTMSLDSLVASLEGAQTERRESAGLNNDPPRIIVLEERAVLVTIDGQARRQALKGSQLERVANTPFFIVYDPAAKLHYLHGAESWYQAADAAGPYQPVESPSPAAASVWEETKRAARAAGENVEEPSATAGVGPPPRIVVATEPTELISTDGPADMVSVPGTGLYYAANTTADVFYDVATARIYALIAGRWFSSVTKAGPWVFVEAKELPADFRKIRPDSDKASVRASVPGTDESRDTVLDAAVPQTARVDRKTARADVTWDGTPRFEPIEGTAISYATNSSVPVFNIEGRYYACSDGVWFEAAGPEGPWAVATQTPPGLEQIPPSNPYYNTKYVEVYETTPEEVYVGYTPEYLGIYPYGGCMVWGTGWYYPPYWGSYYRPYPATWGLGTSYNPWTGWGFSLGFAGPNGWISFGSGGASMGFHFGPMSMGGWHGGWYGVGGYRPSYGAIVNNDINVDLDNRLNTNSNVYNRGGRAREGVASRGIGPDRAKQTPARHASGQAPRPAAPVPARPGGADPQRPATAGGQAAPARPYIRAIASPATDVRNDVLAGADGNVYRQSLNGWESYGRDGWSSAGGYSAAASRDLNRDMSNRQRASSVSRSRPAPRPAPRGGGRRR